MIKVSVKNLLNRYSYNLDLEQNITIIHAPNGRGKSMLLRLIKSVINEEFQEIHEIPFEVLKLYFKNGDFIFVRKFEVIPENTRKKNSDVQKLYFKVRKKDITYNFEVDLIQKLIDVDHIDSIIPGITKLGVNKLFDENSREVISTKRLVKLYGNHKDLFDFDYNFNVRGVRTIDELLEKGKTHEAESLDFIKYTYLNEDYKINMIETDRLYLNKESNILAIGRYSNEIKRILSKLLGEYAEISQSLDKTFPLRLLERMNSEEDLDGRKITSELVSQYNRRETLSNLGLLEKDSFENEFVNTINQKELKDTLLQVLKLYLEDSEEKLKVFSETQKKVSLFLEILNTRFYDKKISLNKKDGFKITFTDTNTELEKFYQLSSGEQHSIVLIYKLLLDEEFENINMVLIDEPELSLHIDWQMGFLDELNAISKITGKHFLIATHSPEIVNERYDLLNLLEPLSWEDA